MGCRKFSEVMLAENWSPRRPRFLFSKVRDPPGHLSAGRGMPLEFGARPQLKSTSAVFMGRSFTITSTSTLLSSFGLGLGITCTIAQHSRTVLQCMESGCNPAQCSCNVVVHERAVSGLDHRMPSIMDALEYSADATPVKGPEEVCAHQHCLAKCVLCYEIVTASFGQNMQLFQYVCLKMQHLNLVHTVNASICNEGTESCKLLRGLAAVSLLQHTHSELISANIEPKVWHVSSGTEQASCKAGWHWHLTCL